ncbi:MAG: hypothetical protein ACREXP_32155 [Steroidobacteraceae bacterium]
MSAHRSRLLGVALLLVSLMASACSTQARWVNCEGRLEPINRPAPKKETSSRGQVSSDSKERAAQ